MKRWPEPETQSALVVLVPEADSFVADLRAKHNPSAAAGVPAHITLLYPFVPPERLDSVALERLRTCCRDFQPFDYELAGIGCFPGLVYLAPEPADAFSVMTARIWEAFPDYPPYEGKHPTVVPHLTVGFAADQELRGRIAEALAVVTEDHFPIAARATGIALLNNAAGRWEVAETILFRQS